MSSGKTRGPIAIVGVGCRLPGGVSSASELLAFLERRGDGVIDVPADRFSTDLHYDPDDGPGKVYVRQAGYLEEDLFRFDPTPFGISPREADHLDPQQRLLLETSLEAFEDAGLPLETLRGSRTGVFIGGFTLDAQALALHPEGRHLVGPHTSTGATMTVLSNRLSYTYDLCGPSLTVDTACSSSLVATHLACGALADGSCDLALVGGVNAILSPAFTLIMCKGRFLASDGRSKAFDAAADGYGRGEGAVVLVLERLASARAHGHDVLAVILGTAVNQDGRTDGMPMPNGEAQVALAREACRVAGVRPSAVGYVEAHGTGTRAGDPLEARALAAVYCEERGETQPLRIGSVKSNVGHLEAGAGALGLLKAALSVRHHRILPQRRLVAPNPDIPFDALKLKVAQEVEPWPGDERPIAAVNSFGYGGTNAHAIVAMAPADEGRPLARAEQQRACLFPLSTETAPALSARAAALLEMLETKAVALDDLAYTLACRHTHFTERAVVRALDLDTLRAGLRALAEGGTHASLVRGRAPARRRSVWVYTGMGPQHSGMGRVLYESDAAFRAMAEKIDALFQRLGAQSLLELVLEGDAGTVGRNDVAQPANFLVQAALTESLRARGFEADAYLGHSVGEVSAAWASGALDLEQATTVALRRARIQQSVAGRGSMLAVGASAEDAMARVRPNSDVVVAAYNAPRSVALAGDVAELDALAERFTAAGVFARRMRVEVAYHSPHMAPLHERFLEELAFVRPATPHGRLYSTTLGGRVESACHDAAYWWRNAREPVLLQRAIEAALDDGFDAFVEIGPHPVLGAAIGEVARARGASIAVASTLHRERDDAAQRDAAIAEMHVAGVPIDWSRIVPTGTHLALPRYPFQRERHWVEAPRAAEERLGRPGAHPLLQRHAEGGASAFRTDLGARPLRWLADHRVDGVALLPGAAYVEAMVAIGAERYGHDAGLVLEDVRFERPLALAYDAPLTLEITLDDDLVRVRSRDVQGAVTEHARGRLDVGARYRAPERIDRAVLEARLDSVDVPALYDRLGELSLAYGPAFRTITELRAAPGEVLARLVAGASEEHAFIHPTVLDGALQALLAAAEIPTAAVPVALRRVRVRRPARGTIFAHGRTRTENGDVVGEIVLFDQDGNVVAELAGVRCRPLRKAAKEPSGDEQQWHHLERFVPIDLPHDAVSDVDSLEELVDPVRVDGRARVVALTLTSVVSDPAGIGIVTKLAELLAELARRAHPPRVRVVTRHAYAPLAAEPVDPAQAALVGLARVAQTELPALDLRIVDLGDAELLPEIRRAILVDDREEEVAFREGGLLARRIERAPIENERRRAERASIRAGTDDAFELIATRPGDLSSLAWCPTTRRAPEGDEVEIAVDVASLNFKDALKALGLLSSVALEGTYLGTRLGMEATGRVMRVGPRAEQIAVGDRVHVYGGGTLASHAIVRAPFVARCDEEQDPLDVASWFVLATAWYGLAHAGRLRRGERVLIHSGAGGVGLAAVHAPRYLGAEVFATAGTPEKRAFLRDLGVAHVYDSRTLDFADDLLRDTEGKGVHVVLSALAGAAQRRSFDVLGTGGRFVELGKQDVAAGRALELLPFNRALSFHAVDLDRLASADESYFAPLMSEVVGMRAHGALPALPREVFTPAEAEAAFRRLSSGALIGKAVIDFRGASVPVASGLKPAVQVRGDRAYLVTGGIGGFGLRTARWLVGQGARHLWLASRRGAAGSATDERELAALRERAAVHTVALDVSDRRAVHDVIARIEAGDAPLGGVFHSAMVLDDRPILSMSREDVARVLEAKALGAWHLHEATRDRKLDYFVLYSSVAALVGNPGQGAYAAANAFLDGLAERRRFEGLAAMSVSWGAIGEIGVVARDRSTEAHLATMGLSPLPPGRALDLLGAACAEGRTRVGILAMDWQRWRRATAPTPWRRLEGLKDEATGDSSGPFERLQADLAARDPATWPDRVAELLAIAAASVFRLPAARVDVDRPLRDLGLDSLMAVELQAALERALGIELTTMELLAGKALRSFVERALPKLAGTGSPASRQSARTDDGSALRERFLATICVQPPYFALDGFHHRDGWLLAEALPAVALEMELGGVGIAETARHLAILGSCAVREAIGGGGRIYFPVRGARLLSAQPSDSREDRVIVRARALEIDRRGSRARALTELVSLEGAPRAIFEMTYHVIDEPSFRSLFASHARETNEGRAVDPYRVVRQVPTPRREGATWSVDLAPVSADECLGHFVGYPAYPVSIMARDAVQLVGAALRDLRGHAVRFAVVGGEAGTERFVFAGEARRLIAEQLGDRRWRTRVETAGHYAAFFDMEICEEETAPAERRRPSTI